LNPPGNALSWSFSTSPRVSDRRFNKISTATVRMMRYEDKKTVAVLASQVSPRDALNIIGHLALAIGAYADSDLMGQPQLPDASGVIHLGISRYPFIVTKAKPAKLRGAIELARADARLLLADYPRQMLTTRTDDDLAYAMLHAKTDSLEYLGAVLFGPADAVNAITGKFSLWQAPETGAAESLSDAT
jgi:hypothetical protein